MQYAFNANNVETIEYDNSPLPAGDYPVVATGSAIKSTKAGNGKYLEFDLEVIEGQHKGRKLWLKMTVENPNQKAVTIGMGQYKSLHEAIGIVSSNDTTELHDKPFIVNVVMGKGDYADRNDIKKIKKYASAPAQSKQPWAQ